MKLYLWTGLIFSFFIIFSEYVEMNKTLEDRINKTRVIKITFLVMIILATLMIFGFIILPIENKHLFLAIIVSWLINLYIYGKGYFRNPETKDLKEMFFTFGIIVMSIWGGYYSLYIFSH